jgi:TonB family protein
VIDTAILNSLWQGALVTAIAAIAASFVPKHHAASRYAVWLTALCGLVAVPLIAAWHPWSVPALLPDVMSQTTAATSVATQRAAAASGWWLPGLWSAGVLFCLGRLVLSYVRIAAVVRGSRPAPEHGRDVRVSDCIAVPIAVGFLHPAVILPAAELRCLAAADLAAILEHERAHIRRGDLVTNLLQRLIEAVLFFNPWTYVIGRQLVKERESACDDWAVAATGSPAGYAAYLAGVALAERNAGISLLTPSAIGSKPLLLGRIARLLNGRAIVVKSNYLAAAVSVAAVAFLALALQGRGVASVPPSLVAETNLPATCDRDVSVVNPVAPDIPENASHATASAVARVTVDSDGRPAGAKIVRSSGIEAIDAATVAAAMKSTYSPAVRQCKATTGTYLFRVDVRPR